MVSFKFSHSSSISGSRSICHQASVRSTKSVPKASAQDTTRGHRYHALELDMTGIAPGERRMT